MKTAARTIFVVAIVAAPLLVGAQTPSTVPDREIGVDEKLGDHVPLDLGFVDADGDSIYLQDVIARPTIIALVYFRCPTICKPLLGGVAEVIERTNLEPGVDYDVWTISFDATDTPEDAAEVRASFAEPIKSIQDGGWRFLTGDSTTIATLTGAVGFNFARQAEDFAHGSCLIVLSPDGKIVRYLFGLRFMPFDVKMAVTEANEGKVSPTIARVLKYCFSYDPEGRKYVFNVLKISGTGILVLMIGWVTYISTFGRNRRERAKG